MTNISQTTQEPGQGTNPFFSGPIDDFEEECLRILRCTALALASSPGGLRFKAGTKPWLEALSRGPMARPS